MSQFSRIIRYLLFCVFFTAGAGAIVLSILIEPELVDYYQGRQMLDQIHQENKKIKSLTADYQAQIELIQSEPNILARLEAVTFGRTPTADTQTADPTPDSKALTQAAKAVLEEIQEEETTEYPLPKWFKRCRQSNIRRALFAAGAGLVIITFLFFGTPKQIPKRTENHQPMLRKNQFSHDRKYEK